MILLIPIFAKKHSYNLTPKLPPPNVFVTVHIEDDTVIKNVNKIQQKLLSVDPRFNSTLQKLTSLHTTFDIFYIDRDHLQKAKTALEFAATMSATHFGPLNITFQRIETFDNITFVSRTNFGSKIVLTQYQKKINEIFKSFGFMPQSKFKYKPHMTLAQLGHDHTELMHKWDFLLKNITKFGNFTPKKLQICAISMARKDLYYPVLAEAYLPQ
uniref:A-kinase anchor protein 7-like phosphoesterase domain-containing protein n=1 Tax=Panagrolaimus superbus TaxID=310955 RepID=A0A914YMR7_9BILA